MIAKGAVLCSLPGPADVLLELKVMLSSLNVAAS